jgi:membrane carboxypeptidase/penicillin-binding protein
MNTMLQDVIRRGTRCALTPSQRPCRKTGTTETIRGSTISGKFGCNGVGFSDHKPVGDNEFGSSAVCDFMRVALDGVPEQRAYSRRAW